MLAEALSKRTFTEASAPISITLMLPGSLAQGNPYKSQLLAAREQGSERFGDPERGEGGCIHLSSFLVIKEELAKTVSTSTQAKPLGLISFSHPRVGLTAVTQPSPARFIYETLSFLPTDLLFSPEIGANWWVFFYPLLIVTDSDKVLKPLDTSKQ